jgi:subtilisin
LLPPPLRHPRRCGDPSYKYHLANSTTKAANYPSIDAFIINVKLNQNVAVAGHQANKSNAKNRAAGMGVGAVKFAYGSAFFGFVASVSEGRLEALRNNPNVASVEFDGERQ